MATTSKQSEYTDDSFEDEWLERMSPRERELYTARRASRRINGSDLTQGEWKEFGRLRALHGDATAHAFFDAIRLKRWREVHGEPRVTTLGTRLRAAAFTALGRGLSALVFVLPATAFGGHLGYVFSMSVAVCVTVACTAAAFLDGKPA